LQPATSCRANAPLPRSQPPSARPPRPGPPQGLLSKSALPAAFCPELGRTVQSNYAWCSVTHLMPLIQRLDVRGAVHTPPGTAATALHLQLPKGLGFKMNPTSYDHLLKVSTLQPPPPPPPHALSCDTCCPTTTRGR
jgi:hypothetical protein